MREEEFDDIVLKLEKFYGNKWFSDERVDILYKKYMKWYPKTPFLPLIEDWVANNQYPPKLNDFRDMGRNITREGDMLPEDYNCERCDSSGWVTYYKKEYLEKYAFRCTCQKGRRLSKRIPFYNNETIKSKLGELINHQEYLGECLDRANKTIADRE